MKQTQIDSFGFSVGRGYSNWFKRNEYIEGDVQTKHGTVSVYIQGCEKHSNITTLRFNNLGRMNVRTHRRRFSTRGAATLAKRFAEEIVGGDK
jgi:hypothetical protein